MASVDTVKIVAVTLGDVAVKRVVFELSRLQSPAAIQAALDEFSRLGRTEFLAKYGYGKSREFKVRDAKTGQLADSKAIG